MQLEIGIVEEEAKNAMFHWILDSKDVFYKSLQVSDAELNDGEKLEVLTELFNRSRSQFLSRYGKYLKHEHLSLFETESTNNYEVKHYLDEIKFRLTNHESLVKNRRFMALQRMMDTSDYFSETEMMRREPDLYHQLVGRYLTDEETRQRDSQECPGDSLVNILLQGIDKDEISRKRDTEDDSEESYENVKKAKRKIDTEIEEFDTDDDEQMEQEANSQTDEPFSKTQWGNFDTLDIQTSSSSSNKARKFGQKVENFILAPEKQMLKDEFQGIMYANFLSGNDKDFDYSTIDEDSQYDDENMRSRDMEDKYFDSEEPETAQTEEKLSQDSEEDDLDIYMKALEKQIHRRDVEDMSNQLEFLKQE
ncbi:coiled-coil domain-containing protein 97 [Culicoides brevitarsis]|uniref:coiled-coil domain-containing protein 97 n=1 Tax=Culicoides brevitarsis TaxID=469753 RepID=UPI00307C2C7D